MFLITYHQHISTEFCGKTKSRLWMSRMFVLFLWATTPETNR